MPESHVHAAHQANAPIGALAVESITERMHALSTGSRVRILYALLEGERTVGELAAAAELTSAATSQQLRILRHLKLVVSRREGQSVHYRLHDAHVAALLDEVRHHVEHASRDWASPSEQVKHEAQE